TLGMSYQPMLTVFARDVLAIGAVGLGALTSAAGLGAVTGALLTGAIGGRAAPRGWLMFGGTALFGVALTGFALSPTVSVSMLALVLVGAGSSMSLATNNALLQEFSPDEMRGRVMSMMFLTRGLIPLGAVVAGVGAERLGAPATMAAFGVAMVVITGLAATLSPPVRRIR
ncbi:MAG: MFS transporter, partial [Dehalococcoidia bacterium]|nr:MFS transporter [Dehalococcoidia bacterium]